MSAPTDYQAEAEKILSHPHATYEEPLRVAHSWIVEGGGGGRGGCGTAAAAAAAAPLRPEGRQ